MKFLKVLSFKKYWPIYLIIFTSFIFYWKVILLGKVPMPADITVGVYYPWLDYKWGYDVGVPVKNPILSDVVSVIYPLRAQAADAIKSGVIPLWTNSIFGGYPLLANFQVAIFNPTFLLFLFFDNITAWSLQVVMQPILTAIFTYLMLRNFKLSKLSSLTGGLIYAFAGFNIIWQQWNAHAFTAGTIPLIILFTNKLIKKFDYKKAALLSFSVALLIFSGYPQLLVYAVLCVGLLILLNLNNIKILNIFKIGLFGFFGILVAGIQLFPAIELMLNSQRTSEFLIRNLAYIPWYNIVTLVAPDYFGSHVTRNFWGFGDYTNNVAYTGLIAFILASIAVINNLKNKNVKYFFLIFIFSLGLAIRNPISDFFYNLGIHGSKAASAARILVLTNLSIASLAAFGIDYIKQKDINIKKIFLAILLPSLIILVALIFTFSFNNNVGIKNLVLPIILLGTSIAILYLIKLFRKTKNIFIVFLCLLSVIELFRFGWKYLPFVDRKLVFPKTPVIEFLQNQENPYRLFLGDVMPMNMAIPYGIETFAGYDAVYPKSVSEYIAVGNSNDINASPMTRYASVNNPSSKLFDLANIKYGLFLNDKVNEEDLNAKNYYKIFEDKSVSVYENKNAYPRAFIVNDKKYLNYDLEKLLTSKISYLDVENIIYSQNAVNIRAQALESSWLFLSDTFYKGWKAYVNGHQVEIELANHNFRYIPLDAGENDVSFVYSPDSFRLGLIVSSISIVFLIALIIRKHESSNT